MSEREVRAAIARICSRLEQRAAHHGLPRGARGVLVPMLLGFSLVGAAACEGTTESGPGGAGGLDAGVGGDGLSDAGGTDPGGFDAYGSPFPDGGGGTGGWGDGGSGGLGGVGGSGGSGGLGGS